MREAVGAMEECFENIRAWMTMDQLKLNDGKTEIIPIGTQQQLDKVNNTSHLRIGQATAPPVSTCKFHRS